MLDNKLARRALALRFTLGATCLTAAACVVPTTPASEAQSAAAAGQPWLTFAAQPSGGTAGTPLATQPRLALANLAAPGLSVRLALGEGQGQLAGTTTAQLVGGAAQFADLSCLKSGELQLTAQVVDANGQTVAGVPSVQSAPFTIVAAAAARLGAASVPSQAVAGRPLAPPPSWPALDAYGNPTSLAPTDVVTLQLAGGSAPLRGATSFTAGGPAATFPGVDIDTAASYRLQASFATAAGPVVTVAAADTVVAAASPVSTLVATGLAGGGRADPGLSMQAGGTQLAESLLVDSHFAAGPGAAAAGLGDDALRGGLGLAATAACDGTTTQCVALDPSWTPHYGDLIGYWRFDGVGAVADGATVPAVVGPALTAHNANGTGMSYVPGHVGGGLSLDGTDDYLSLPSGFPGTGTMTFAGWVNVAQSHSYQRIFDFGSDTNNYFNLAQVALDYSLAAKKNAGAEDGIHSWTGFAAGIWQHLVVTTDGALTSFYLNGQPLSCMPSTTTPASFVATNSMFGGSQFTVDAKLMGTIDEFALWQRVLTEQEVAALYARQASPFGGTAVSAVQSVGAANAGWRRFAWQTRLPAAKPLVGTASESTADYPDLVGPGAASGLVALWHLNEPALGGLPGGGDFADGTGGTNVGSAVNFVDLPDVRQNSRAGMPGRLGHSVIFGIDNSQPAITTALTMTPPAALSIQAWFASSYDQGGHLVGFVDQQTGHPSDLNLRADRHIYLTPAGTLAFGVVSGGSQKVITSSATYRDRAWHHVVATLSAAGMALFVDGQQVASDATVTAADPYAGYWRMGDNGMQDSSWPQHPAHSALLGNLAEVAVWSRALGAAEILQLWRRGSESVDFQLRACSQPDCADSPPWQGPDGGPAGGFGEFSILAGGQPQAAAPQLSLPALTPPLALAPTPYFQYRARLSAWDVNSLCSLGGSPAACRPVVTQAAVDAVEAPSASAAATFTLPSPPSILGHLTEVLGADGCPGGVGYTLSVDGQKFWTYSGGAWQPSDGTAATAAPAAALTDLAMRDFGRQVGRPAGALTVRAFLRPAGAAQCELAGLSLSGWH